VLNFWGPFAQVLFYQKQVELDGSGVLTYKDYKDITEVIIEESKLGISTNAADTLTKFVTKLYNFRNNYCNIKLNS